MSVQSITGGCSCGAVRYEARQAPGFMFLCHCDDCQKASGAGHSALMIVKRENLEVTGPVRRYRSTAASRANTTRLVCDKCGSPLINEAERFAEIAFLHAASLDDRAIFKPAKSTWNASAPAWDYVDPELPRE